MKIGIRRVGPLGALYNDKYDTAFFEKLWHEHLIERLKTEDEVIWFEKMPVDAEGFDRVLGDLDAVIGAWIFDNMITDEMLTKHPQIKYIGTISHGYSEFDKEACRKHGVTVTNTHFNDYAVAQHTMGLLLEIALHIGANSTFYKKTKWEHQSEGNNKFFTKQMELQGKTIGIVGLGNIGLNTAKMAAGFGMKVQAYDKKHKEGEEYSFLNQVDFNTLLSTSDIISLHCPATKETRHLINRDSIQKMKDGVILLNTARGDLINEQDLYEALNNSSKDSAIKKIYAVGLDVLEGEPLKKPSILLQHPQVIATEHIAWATPESRIRSVTIACDNFLKWRAGMPQSVIS